MLRRAHETMNLSCEEVTVKATAGFDADVICLPVAWIGFDGASKQIIEA